MKAILPDLPSFAELPGAIEHYFGASASSGSGLLLTDTPKKHLVLILLDAFGFTFLERFRSEIPTLDKFYNEGSVRKIRSQFPSTTTAQVTTLQSGLPVGKTGLYEWVIWEPVIDDLFIPLLFSRASQSRRESLSFDRVDPKELYPESHFAENLKKLGVSTTIFLPREFANATPNRVTCGSAERVGYVELPATLKKISNLLNEATGRQFISFYFADIDTTGHIHGPDSKQFATVVKSFFLQLEHLLAELPDDTTLLLTADHGQVSQDLTKRIWLNEEFPWLKEKLKKNQIGKSITPTGSARDAFLFVQDEALDDVFERLSESLYSRADVYKTSDLISGGLFGSEVSDRLRMRLGNITILPRPELSCWWKITGGEQMFLGHHGGLTLEECEIPLVVFSP